MTSRPGSPPRFLGLAVAQMGPVHLSDSRESVVARLVDMLRQARGRGAEFVTFPELALTTFFPRYWMTEEEARERFFERSMPGPATQPLFDEARRLGVGFYLGYAELTEDGRAFNSAVIVGRDGSIAGRYRKIHLPGHSEHKPEAPFQHLEKKFFEVGDLGFRAFDTDGVRMGMCLCNDRRWPETYRVMALQGAEVVVLGYNTPSLNIHWNEPAHLRTTTHLISLQANAYQNGAVVQDLRGHWLLQGKVGVLGTPATLALGLYQRALEQAGYETIVPEADDVQRHCVAAIAAVKAGQVDAAWEPAAQGIRALVARGAKAVVLGCTELPLAVPHNRRGEFDCVLTDSIDALALAAIAHCRRGH